MKESTVNDCMMVDLPRHTGARCGNLTEVTGGDSCFPFEIRRVYYLYDVPAGYGRGAHAHRTLRQMLVAVSGSFTVTVGDGRESRTFRLDRPYQGLLLAPGLWRTIDNFSSGSVCLVLASEIYDEKDYIREYQEFLEYKGQKI